jgi:hypothetical protein
MDTIPYIVFEGEQARHERTVKRLVIALLVSIALMFASNMAWLWFFNQFDITSEDITVDGTQQGNANFIGEDGVINNGRGEVQEDGTEE